MTRIEEISPQIAGAATSNTMTTNVVEEIGNAFSVGDNSAHSNRESRENKGGNGVLLTKDRGCSKKPLCDGSR